VQLVLPFAPTSVSTLAPTSVSTLAPTSVSTLAPTSVSTLAPTSVSTLAPTSVGTLAPTSVSTLAPTGVSTLAPTSVGTLAPTSVSTLAPIYYVRHRRARRYLLRVEHDGRLRVTIPRGGSRREADAFVGRHLDWVARERARLTTTSTVSFEERYRNRQQARAELPARLLELAARHGLTVTRVSVRNQRTRWGSCGRDGHISLNWRLVLMPADVRDYVLVHELMHLRRLDHSRAYWRLVAAACPRYREARQWLRVNGPSLR
jgi:predicted metal-dependent hydrolase